MVLITAYVALLFGAEMDTPCPLLERDRGKMGGRQQESAQIDATEYET